MKDIEIPFDPESLQLPFPFNFTVTPRRFKKVGDLFSEVRISSCPYCNTTLDSSEYDYAQFGEVEITPAPGTGILKMTLVYARVCKSIDLMEK